MLKERETYIATKGVENEGYDFEVAMLSFYCFHLSYSEALNFKIAIYDNRYHPFDDIVIDITTTDLIEKYAIQLKHVKDKLLLNSNHFGKNGKMVLSKYFKYDFTKSDHVVLLTNGVVNEELVVGNCTIKTKTLLTPMERCLDTSTDKGNHIYEIYNDETENKITFYTAQKSRTDIDEAVRQKFKEKFFSDGDNVDNIAHKFRKFFQEWKRGAFNVCKLDKEDIKMKIAEIIFFEYLIEYTPKFSAEVDRKTELLQGVLTSFDVAIADKVDNQALHSLCRFNLQKENVINDGQTLLINVSDNENKDLAFILWRLEEFPLILRVNSDNLKIVSQLVNELQGSNLSFILVGNITTDDLSSRKVLVTLKDLEGSDYFQEVINNYTLSIQGSKEISLQELTNYNPKFSTIITTEELLLIAQGNFVVGEMEDPLPQPYIPRHVYTPVIKITDLEHLPNELFLIRGDIKLVKEKLPKFRFWNYDTFMEIASLGKSLPPRSIVMFNPGPKIYAFTIKYKYSNVHSFKVIDNEHLKLNFSREKSEKLRRLQVCHESELHHFMKSKINFVCAGHGMGKTTLLRYLRRNCPPGYWTAKFDLQDPNSCKPISTLDLKFKKCFKEVQRVIYFFCGMDHVSERSLQKTIDEIKKIQGQSIKVWVFASDRLRERFETSLDVPAMNIEEFSEEEQQRYVQQRLGQGHMDHSFEKIIKSFRMLKHNDILGAPMHLYMLTEILIADPKANMDKMLVVTDIFKYFIKTKYQHYLRKVCSDYNNQIIKDGTYYRTEQYKLIAISFLEGLKFKIKVQVDKHFLNQIGTIGDVLGIVVRENTESGIIFSQQTYADYFAAMWLVDNFKEVENITDLLHQDDFKNVLFMFNLEICKNNPAHIAVLYQNLEQLQNCNLNEFDPLKRSALHLACAYETKMVKIPQLREKRILAYHTREFICDDKKTNEDIIDCILTDTCFDPLQVDDFVGWNLLDYAFNSLNIYAVEKILVTFPSTASAVLDKIISSKEQLFKFVYTCVRHSLPNLLKLTTQVLNFEEVKNMDDHGENLLYTAVKYECYEIAKILLNNGANTETVTLTVKKRTPLHMAAETGYNDIVDLLLERGAVVDAMDRYRNTPLHLAASKGFYDIVELLLACGADLNFSDNFGRTALHLAATNGHTQVVQMLLNHGALATQRDRLGNSPQGYAREKNHQRIVEILTQHGTTPKIWNQQDVEEYIAHPLHWVVSAGQVEQVQVLLKEGRNINQVDHLGRTPLYRAVERDFVKVVEILIENDADINISDINKVSPLCQAIINHNHEITEMLLEKEVEVNVTDKFGYTPLHWAAIVGNDHIVKLLLTKNADFDALDCFGRKPIQSAVEAGHSNVVMTLYPKHPKFKGSGRKDVFFHYYNRSQYLNHSKLTSFEEAVVTGNVALVKKFLIQKKIEIITDEVLHAAVVRNYKTIIELLLQNKVISNTHKPLHWAAFIGNKEIVELLVKYGVDINALDTFGFNAVFVATMKTRPEVLEVLLKNGGDPTVEAYGTRIMDWALKKGSLKCLRVLLEYNPVETAMQEHLLNVAEKQQRFLKIVNLERD